MNPHKTYMPPNGGVLDGAAGGDPQRRLPLDPERGERRPGGRNVPAVTAMALGVVGLATSIVCVGGLLGVLGLAMSVPALRTAGRTGTGRSQAVAGVVTSSLAIVTSVAVVILAVWFAHKTQSCYHLRQIGPWMRCVGQQLDRH